jgi:hypothetical protein
MCAEVSTVLRGLASYFFFNCWCLEMPSDDIFSLLLFTIKNNSYFTFNTDIHDINTRYNYNLHLPSTNLSIVQKGVLFSGSKIYSHLPLKIKLLSKDPRQFKTLLN